MNNTKPIDCIRMAACLLLLSTAPAVADDALSEDIAACAAISDSEERLACFDALTAAPAAEPAAPRISEPASPAPAAVAAAPAATATAEPAAAAVAPEPPAAAGPTPITDDIGRERIEGGRDEERPEYAANVVRCEENQQSGQTYFFFENGQVWRQANYRRLRFRECRFAVELSEDNFGYTMRIPSEDRRLRVTRIR